MEINGAELINISNVTKLFGSAQTGVLALDHATLSVREGKFLSLIGPSGCGKSTLLRLIAGLLAPTAGQIQIRGKMPEEARLARECGLVFQAPTLMEWRSIRLNIELPLEVVGVSSQERADRSAGLLSLIRLTEFSHRYPQELSVGMQQQVSIARALAARPAVLLMDEPFGALDEITRERLGQELLGLWSKTHVTIVFVTHSVEEAVMLSDRVAVFTPRPGRVDQVIPIDLPRPRRPDLRETPEFARFLRQVRAALRLNQSSQPIPSQANNMRIDI